MNPTASIAARAAVLARVRRCIVSRAGASGGSGMTGPVTAWGGKTKPSQDDHRRLRLQGIFKKYDQSLRGVLGARQLRTILIALEPMAAGQGRGRRRGKAAEAQQLPDGAAPTAEDAAPAAGAARALAATAAAPEGAREMLVEDVWLEDAETDEAWAARAYPGRKTRV